jgi:hypothetical protein
VAHTKIIQKITINNSWIFKKCIRIAILRRFDLLNWWIRVVTTHACVLVKVLCYNIPIRKSVHGLYLMWNLDLVEMDPLK